MTFLRCSIKGRYTHRQADPKGIEKGEYIFITENLIVGVETCRECTYIYCPYGINQASGELKKKILDFIYDCTLQDELLKNGLTIETAFTIWKIGTKTVFSQPCYNKTEGEILEKIDEELFNQREITRKILTLFSSKQHTMKPLTQRVLFTGEKQKQETKKKKTKKK